MVEFPRWPECRGLRLLYWGREHFGSGLAVRFAIRYLPAAVEEMRSVGIELLGKPGPTWQHFRGPDRYLYELVAS